MGLYRRMALALLAVGLVACGEGEGEGEGDAVATDTSNKIGGYSQTVPQVMSALPGSPVASGSTDVRNDYGKGTVAIKIITSICRWHQHHSHHGYWKQYSVATHFPSWCTQCGHRNCCGVRCILEKWLEWPRY